MEAFIKPSKKIPFYLKIGIWITKKVTGKDLLVPKLLSWYPKAAIGSGILESLVAHGGKDLDKRLLKLVRIQASLTVSCPFCIDMNSYEYKKYGITEEEIILLQSTASSDNVSIFSTREKLAMEYTRCICTTPINIPGELVPKIRQNFTEREIVILASTVAQVNYWARLIQALGVPPAGFSKECEIYHNFHTVNTTAKTT